MKKLQMDKSGSIILYLLLTIFLHALSLKILEMIIPNVSINEYANFMTKVLMGILVVETLFFVRKTPLQINWTVFKIEKDCKFKRELMESTAIAIALIVMMVVYRLYLNSTNPQVAARPAFGLYLDIHARWFYPVSAIIQEAFIKGMVQHNIGYLESGKSKHLTIWITAIFFGVLHRTYPLYYMCGAAILCAFTGYLYERDKNIWGSVIIHFVIGFMPRALGLKV